MEDEIRLAAFAWLKEQKTAFDDDVLPRTLLEKGFMFRGQPVALVGPSGIWKPKVFEKIPVSITTTYDSPYKDAPLADGFLQYSYRGTDRNHRDNLGLREAMLRQVPLIYFLGIVPGKYLAVWPVFIVADDPDRLSFTVAADEAGSWIGTRDTTAGFRVSDDNLNAKRQYITAAVKYRLHQRAFREKVLHAYREQCAFCKLRHTRLLDAAHIISDSDLLGEPVVTNGLSLCKIHHAAFDTDLIGVTSDYIIKVREDILRETDGPMLRYGIQELQNQKIILPGSRKLWPDQERLELRYEKFRDAV